MEETLPSSIFSKFVLAIVVVGIFDLVFVNWWILNRANQSLPATSNQAGVPTGVISPMASPSPLDSSGAESTSNKVSSSTPTPTPAPSPTTIPVVSPSPVPSQTIIQTASKEIFIPLGSGSVTTNSFSDIAGSDVTIDLTKYPGVQSIVFQASIWVEGGNGRAYARIYNVDDKNPYFESQITNNTGVGSVQNSLNIPLPYSTKTYRIQAKTDITQYAAHIDNARFKITLK